jgi:hypothetical protein
MQLCRAVSNYSIGSGSLDDLNVLMYSELLNLLVIDYTETKILIVMRMWAVVFWVDAEDDSDRFLKNIGNTTLHDVTTQKTAVDNHLTDFFPSFHAIISNFISSSFFSFQSSCERYMYIH